MGDPGGKTGFWRHRHSTCYSDASPDALLALDADGTILLANTAAGRLFGYSRDELTGSNHWMLLSEGFRNGRRELLHARLVAQPDQPRGRVRCYGLHRDGTEFAAEIAGSLLDGGGTQILLLSVRGTGHRKGPDADLSEAMSLLTATLESTADGILVISSRGQDRRAQRAVPDHVGHPAGTDEGRLRRTRHAG